MGTGEKLLAAGGVVAGLGAALGVPYYIYSLEFGETFWSWPGYLSVGLLVIGVALCVAGLLARGDAVSVQRQRGGAGSRNYQAGRDITIERGDDGDR